MGKISYKKEIYKNICKKNIYKKAILYVSAAMLFATSPVQPVLAAEVIPQAPETPAETSSQPADGTTPAETPGNTTVPGTQPPSDITVVAPSEDATGTPQPPSDDATGTPLPTPADPGTPSVTPMQSTVYAASPKGLNVRSGPSTAHSKLGTLQYGQEVTVTGKTADNWYQIQFSGGVGYVLADYVSATPVASTQKPDTGTSDANTAVPPAAESPENPGTDATENPPDAIPDNEPASAVPDEEDSTSGENYNEVTSRLLGTPIIILLTVAVLGVLAMICYSVYSLFKREPENDEDAYDDGDEQYDEDPYIDDGYDEREPYSDDDEDEEYEYPGEEYPGDEYADGKYPDDRYADDEYPDDEYPDDEYPDDQYSDDRYDSAWQDPDDEYYGDDETYSDEEYYEDNDKL